MIVIRFVRVGRNKQAYFHLVAAEKSRAVQKKYIEKLGHYNPHSNSGKGELVFNEDKTKHFINNGAQLSQTVARLLVANGFKEAGKFVAQRATKPKKTEPPKTVVDPEPAEREAPVVEAKEPEAVQEETVEEKTAEAPEKEESVEVVEEKVEETEEKKEN